MALGMLFVGCSGWFGEPAPTPPSLKVKYSENDPNTVQCFDKIKVTYDDFFSGQLEKGRFKEAMDCTEDLLLRGTAKVQGGEAGSYTAREAVLIFDSGILDEKEQIETWVKRFYGLANLMHGSKRERLSISEFHDIFELLKRADIHFVELSKLAFAFSKVQKNDFPLEKRQTYWRLLGKIIQRFIDIAGILLQNTSGSLERLLYSKQFGYFAPQMDHTEWDKWVEAVFLMNEIIFSRTKELIQAENIPPLLSQLRTTFGLVFEGYALSEKLKVDAWDAQDLEQAMRIYLNLLYNLLNEFYQTEGKKIEKKSLARLFNVLHIATAADATLFIDTISKIKSQMTGNTKQDFDRSDIRKLKSVLETIRDAFHEGELNANLLSDEDRRKVEHLWQSPFLTLFDKNETFLKLSSVFLSLIDPFIAVYDGNNHDQKISLYEGEAKTLSEELKTLLDNSRSLIAGYQALVRGLNSVNSSDENNALLLGALSDKDGFLLLSKIIFAFSDQVFKNSNHDGMLDRFELLEVVSFYFENYRMVGEVYNAIMKVSAYNGFYEFENRTYQQITPRMIREKEIQKILDLHFPNLRLGFSSSIAYDNYLKCWNEKIIGKFQLGLKSQFQSVLAGIRLLESLFDKYDQNRNQLLDPSEIITLYQHFSPFLDEIFSYFAKSEKQRGALATFGVWGVGGDQEVRKRAFFHLVTNMELVGDELPPEIDLNARSISRMHLVLLMEYIFNRFQKELFK